MNKTFKFEKYENSINSVITIGTFDGVHVGHQKIIKRLVKTAKKENLKAVVLTFFPHPRMVLQKDANIKLINTIEEKAELFNKFGIDNLVVKKFTKAFSRLSAEDFAKQVLVDKLNAKKVIIGYDHHFGRNRRANIDDLRRFGETYGFEVEEISMQDINDVAISSTKIRNALAEGDIIKANTFLGYDFMISGTIVRGKGLGKQMDFPTANLGQVVFGMMNIGTNPTVNGNDESIETHFFNFDQDIYNQKIRINVLQRIRDEQRFESVEALKTQIHRDKKTALNYIASYHA
jgi:riboflavin kinase/FMN adenylyltransferase